MAEEWLLVMDCSGEEALVALARGGKVMAERRIAGRRSGEELLPALKGVLGVAGVNVGAISGIGVVRGPGSFTGVRVGLSAAKGLSEGLGVPLAAVSRFAVMARAAGVPQGVVVLRAGRGEWYWGRRGDGADEEQGVGTQEEVRGRMRAGETLMCPEEDAAAWPGAVLVGQVSADDVVEAVQQERAEGRGDPVLLLDGLYLRRTEAELLERQRQHRAGSEGRG